MNIEKRNERFRLLASAAISCALGMSYATLIGCDRNDTPGEAVDEAIDETEDALDDAADEVDDAVDDAADDIDDAVDDDDVPNAG